MKEPSTEWIMVCDLMQEIEHLNLNITPNSESFVEGLYNFLDPYAPFLEQQSEAQKTWLNDLWNTYCNPENQTEINLEDF